MVFGVEMSWMVLGGMSLESMMGDMVRVGMRGGLCVESNEVVFMRWVWDCVGLS